MPDASTRIAAPTVLTIHGVCPGPWQETAQRVFAPHFGYAAIAYSEYDCLRGGAVKAVAHPLFLLAAAVVGGWTAYARPSAWWFTAAIGLVLAGAWVARVQRRRCADRIKARISDEVAGSFATHVIAHSFGTYLTARAMAFYDIVFDRVVLVGCVLPRRFDWQNVFDRHRPPDTAVSPAALEIRNEVGSADAVVRLAGLTAWLTRELGSAGLKGFLAGRHAVHSIASPWHACGACPDSAVAVHNVSLGEYGHSTWALGPGHALHIWLPFLWGYPPAEFRDWLNVCSKATRALQMANGEEFAEAAVLLLRREWTWTRWSDGTPRSLEVYLTDPIGGQAKAIREEIVTALVHAVRAALDAALTENQASEKTRWRLNPRLAIDYTIADVLRTAPS
jgi:hypothetical protein